MLKKLDKSWIEWTELNLSRGCDKSQIMQILLDHQFDPANIIHELKHHPSVLELTQILNQQLSNYSLGPSHDYPSRSEVAANTQAIDSIILPLANRIKTDQAHIYTLDGFLSKKECEGLITLIRSQCRPSTLTNPNEPDQSFRTSQTCDLGLIDNQPLIREIDRRISEYMGMETERSETIQGQFYQVGQQFKTHTDYFEPNTPEYDRFAGELGQRTWTFMIYLNEVSSGGETEFPVLNTTITPTIGMAVIWNSLHPDGSVNPATAHWAKPIIEGEKFIITKWFRTYGSLKDAYHVPAPKTLPVFTQTGFKKMQVPNPLQAELEAFYQLEKTHKVEERNDAIGRYIKSDGLTHPAHMIELSDAMRSNILEVLTPLLESWTNCALEPSAVYGIREYQRGASLAMHADRIDTHLVSAIINVAQQVNTDWPICIQDHMGKSHEVLLKPGEMLFYESARLEHGRPTPLDGDFYANIFTHTRPLIMEQSVSKAIV